MNSRALVPVELRDRPYCLSVGFERRTVVKEMRGVADVSPLASGRPCIVVANDGEFVLLEPPILLPTARIQLDVEDIRACTGQNIWLTRSRQSLSLLRLGYLPDQSGNSWDREQQFKEEQARAKTKTPQRIGFPASSPVQHSKGEAGAMVGLYRRALESRARILGNQHPETIAASNRLAELLHRSGNKQEVQRRG